jgi:hypothetical protein
MAECRGPQIPNYKGQNWAFRQRNESIQVPIVPTHLESSVSKQNTTDNGTQFLIEMHHECKEVSEDELDWNERLVKLAKE